MTEIKIAPPSKYQPEVDKLVKKFNAKAVFLVVLGGTRGAGAASTVRASLVPKLGALLVGIGSEMLSDPQANVSSVTLEE